MGDVIEASEDGGFDIPTTSVAPPPSRVANLPSKEDPSRVKPRRIMIQLEDDDDDDDEDGNEGTNDGERNSGGSTVTAPTGALRPEKTVGSPTVERPQYKIYKVETLNEDPMLEIVVSRLTENKVAPISTAATAAKAKHLGATGAHQAPSCPSVNVSSDGGSIVVEHNPAAKDGAGVKDGGADARGRFTLKLPQKVVPRTAMGFFWEGDLTIRAALAGVG